MNRETLTAYIVETYSVEPDRPWARYPDYEVFRHGGNRKWFAVLLRVSRKTLGLEGDDPVQGINQLLSTYRELRFYDAHTQTLREMIVG